MVEGGSSKEFRHIKAMLYSQPEVLHALLDVLAKSVIDYLNAQIQAGAQAVQIFDKLGWSVKRCRLHRVFLEIHAANCGRADS